MAYQVRISEQSSNSNSPVIRSLYYYNLHGRMGPGFSETPSDIMLVQFMIYTYFLMNSGGFREEFFQVYDQVTADGSRWDDGIYGQGTRLAIDYFEQDQNFRRDAVFEPFDELENTSPKFKFLNWTFSWAAPEYTQTLIQNQANPLLYSMIRAHGTYMSHVFNIETWPSLPTNPYHYYWRDGS